MTHDPDRFDKLLHLVGRHRSASNAPTVQNTREDADTNVVVGDLVHGMSRLINEVSRLDAELVAIQRWVVALAVLIGLESVAMTVSVLMAVAWIGRTI